MIFKVAALFLPIIAVLGDNTPNLCTSDIEDLLRIAPSTTGVENIPNITVGGETYNGDADHFVIGSTTRSAKKGVLIYLPGTTDRPELSSCLLKDVALKAKYPVVGLSYAYLSSGDSFRNGKCQSLREEFGLSEQINCLDQQHIDAIDGGDYGCTHYKEDGVTEFWNCVDSTNSITARVLKLVEYMDEMEPDKGWNSLVKNGKPRWKKINVMGHSQGSGHAAYLGKTKKMKGVAMISGPQDQCVDCEVGTEFWIDESYKTSSSYTAFGHSAEPLYNIMAENWNRMNNQIMMADVIPEDVGFADKKKYNACFPKALKSNILFAATSTCGGKEHCSTAIDDTVPFIELMDGKKKYLYNTVWEALARTDKC